MKTALPDRWKLPGACSRVAGNSPREHLGAFDETEPHDTTTVQRLQLLEPLAPLRDRQVTIPLKPPVFVRVSNCIREGGDPFTGVVGSEDARDG